MADVVQPPQDREGEDAAMADAANPSEPDVAAYKMLSFDDGNIILQSATASFRVHRSILSVHSEVFRDMFQVATAGDDVLVDGVPAIPVMDTAADLFEFLKAIYFPMHIHKSVPKKMSLVVTLLEMSTKYMAEVIRQQFVERLRMLYPQGLEAYRMTWEQPLCDLQFPRDAMLAVEAGLKYNIPEILPSAFYDCCTLDMDDLLDGVVTEDGVRIQLSPSTLKTCLRGRYKLYGIKRHVTFGFVQQYISEENRLHCHDALGPAIARLLVADTEISDFRAFEDDVSLFEPYLCRGAEVAGDMCEACREEWKAAEKASQRLAWAQLPKCFGLQWGPPPWATVNPVPDV